MTEVTERAKGEGGKLYSLGPEYIYWQPGDKKIILDGEFTVADLKALVLHMETQ